MRFVGHLLLFLPLATSLASAVPAALASSDFIPSAAQRWDARNDDGSANPNAVATNGWSTSFIFEDGTKTPLYSGFTSSGCIKSLQGSGSEVTGVDWHRDKGSKAVLTVWWGTGPACAGSHSKNYTKDGGDQPFVLLPAQYLTSFRVYVP